MNVGHVLVCQNEVVSRSVHVSGNLRKAKTPQTQLIYREVNSFVLTCFFVGVFSTHLHEEPGQQSSFDVVGVRLGAEGGLRDGKLDPVQGVGQLRSDGLSRLQGRVVQGIVLAPLFCAQV